MKNRKLELLAPAGSFESLKAAVSAGADAVYMGGGRFGARAYAQNPQGESLLDAIDYAHLRGVKVYLTVNTLLKEDELEQELYEYLKPCYEHGLDAVLVQDLGVLCAIRSWFPDLPVHASTQMTLCGSGGVEFLKELGIERAVLSRELSLKEIQAIHEETGMELETFVHGALCYCYSGQCLFSSILGGRSGNRGRCAQPCRLSYQAVSGDGRVLTGEQPLLSPKDICALDLLPKIAEAGVYSLKIEGRMKRPEYTAGVVRIYRKYVDRYVAHGAEGYRVEEADRKELLLLFNRDGFSDGYYEQHNGRNMMALEQKKASDQEKRAYEERIQTLREAYVEQEKKIPIRGSLYAEEGKPMRFVLSVKAGDTVCETEVYGAVPELAKNRPMEEEQFRKQMRKMGNCPFEWEDLHLEIKGSLFVPVAALNTLRRDGMESLENKILEQFRRVCPENGQNRSALPETEKAKTNTGRLHISVETRAQLEAVLAFAQKEETALEAVYAEAAALEQDLLENGSALREASDRTGGWKIYVLLPPVFRLASKKRYEAEWEKWKELPIDGFVIRNLEEYTFLKEHDWQKELLLDHNVYTMNRRSRAYWRKAGVQRLTNPLELNARELKGISDKDAIQVVYGRYPMMVTAGCLHKTLEKCGGQMEQWTLKDRYRKEFPVKNFCRDCYNVIYNSQPLYLLDKKDELESLGAGAYRLMFTTESKNETRKVLEQWLTGASCEASFTRGHFKRGVE